MQQLETGSTRHTTVCVMDEPSAGGVHHEYVISPTDSAEAHPVGEFGYIRFQHGPIVEAGVNGCHHEDLLAIVVHRLRCFQAGPYACLENAMALIYVERALKRLNNRTADRERRGVEGTSAL